MSAQERREALNCCAKSSVTKEVAFTHAEVSKQVQAGHITVFLWEAIASLPKLWLSPVSIITHMVRRPLIVYDFTWSGLNAATKCLSPMESMRFGRTLWRILQFLLASDPHIGPVYIIKVDLVTAYMWLWVKLE